MERSGSSEPFLEEALAFRSLTGILFPSEPLGAVGAFGALLKSSLRSGVRSPRELRGALGGPKRLKKLEGPQMLLGPQPRVQTLTKPPEGDLWASGSIAKDLETPRVQELVEKACSEASQIPLRAGWIESRAC